MTVLVFADERPGLIACCRAAGEVVSRQVSVFEVKPFLWDFQDLWSRVLWHPWRPSASHCVELEQYLAHHRYHCNVPRLTTLTEGVIKPAHFAVAADDRPRAMEGRRLAHVRYRLGHSLAGNPNAGWRPGRQLCLFSGAALIAGNESDRGSATHRADHVTLPSMVQRDQRNHFPPPVLTGLAPLDSQRVRCPSHPSVHNTYYTIRQ